MGIAAVHLAAARGDRRGVRFAADRLSVECDRVPDLPDLLARWCSVARAQSLLTLGTPEAVLDVIDPPAGTAGFAAAIERVALAKAHLAMDQPHLVRKLLEPLIDNEFDATFLGPAVDTRILLALAAARENRDNAALTLITEAIDLAQPEGLLQPFLDGGRPAAILIARHRQVGARHRDFTSQLLTTSSAGGGSSPATPVEHLAERELIVLRYLPTMLKAGEIAKELYVTVNTVKSHMRAIYRKLGVATRREAVDRARALNLL